MPYPIAAKARYDLPKDMSAGIGRIITRWSYAETKIQTIIYELLYVEDAVGRIAVREPRVIDRLSMILDLMEAEDARFEPDMLAAYKAIRKDAEDLGFVRDLCAHGSWSYSREHKSWCVTNTRGSWEQGQGITGKKRIKPEGLLFDPTALISVAREIEVFIEKLSELYVMVGISMHAASLKRQP